MKVMDKTITRAASGEIANLRRRRIHNLRQKDRRVTNTIFCMLFYCLLRLEKSNLFLINFLEVVTMKTRRAIVSVVGRDQVGIIAKVTKILYENNINILDISQTILNDFFTMMMVIDVSGIENLEKLQNRFNDLGEEISMKINVQLEEIFQSMHRV
jgi:ACT domain-containing protein